jgi:hypothetical protein
MDEQALRDKLTAALDMMADVASFTVAPEPHTRDMIVTVAREDEGGTTMYTFPVSFATIEANEGFGLEQIVRAELPWPAPDGPQYTWRYLVWQAEHIDAGYRDKPVLTIPPNTILAIEAELAKARNPPPA